MTRESMVDLLTSISGTFSKEETLVRISGTSGMGDIVAITAILFPSDTTLIVDDAIVLEGSCKLLYLEFKAAGQSGGRPTHIEVEKVLNNGKPDIFPIAIVPNKSPKPGPRSSSRWTGHVADALQIKFADFGVVCTPALLVACCDLLIFLPSMARRSDRFYTNDVKQPTSLPLLGPEPMQRMFHVCRLVLRKTPSMAPPDVESAYLYLVQLFRELQEQKPDCTCNRCQL
jgi:hypothetical protein